MVGIGTQFRAITCTDNEKLPDPIGCVSEVGTLGNRKETAKNWALNNIQKTT